MKLFIKFNLTFVEWMNKVSLGDKRHTRKNDNKDVHKIPAKSFDEFLR